MGFLRITVPVLCAAAAVQGARAEFASNRRQLQQLAGCDFLITTKTDSESAILAANAVADATAIVCGSGSSSRDEIDVVAEASARAAAVAVANVAGKCYANGNGSFKVNGLTIAQAEARAYAEAFAKGTTSASACGRCSAAAEFVASSWSELFFEAVAAADTNLRGSANGGSVTAATDVFVEAVAEATVIAYAGVLATATASVDDGCNTELLIQTATGDINDVDEVFCDVNVAGLSTSVATDAVVSAVFEARAETCDGRAQAGGRVAARELAVATAQALSQVVADCAVIGNGYACVLGEADVNTMAKATADAFARGFVEAVSTCDPPRCTISFEAIAENTETVLVKAASEAYGAACAGSNEEFSLAEIEDDIVTATIDALAEVIVEAVVEDEDCTVSFSNRADVVATTTCNGKCAANNKKCGGKNFDKVLSCCSEDYLCVKKNDNYFACRRDGEPKSGWDGSIVPCG